MTVRHAETSDLEKILLIYEGARETMRLSGNPTQWGTNRPSRERVLRDIDEKISYAIENDGKIVGVFVFFVGNDPTYDQIDGSWLNDLPYGVIHRIAADRNAHGILSTALDFAGRTTQNLRIDTHENNAKMRFLLEKYGFTRCGIILTDDGTPRIAYQRTKWIHTSSAR